MKIFVIGDPHFKSKNVLETNEMCNRIYEEVIKEKPDFIVVLGDVLDTHETIHVGPLCRATEFLFKLSGMSNHLYVLVGNHDRPNNSVFLTTDSPFNACKSWKNTTIVDKVEKANYQNKKFLFVPYVPTGRLAEALLTEDINKDNINEYSIVFAHQEFKGCNMGVITSNEGDEWDKSYPLCISGHIHDYQVLQPNLIYPGTPIQHGYGDSPNKAIMIIEESSTVFEDLDEISLDDEDEISSSKYITRRINLGLPKKITVQITSEELIDYVIPENSFVKLIVKGETDKVKEVMKLEKVKELLKNERIKLSIQEYKKKKDDLNIETSLLSEVMSTKFVSFQERLQKVLGGEKDEVKTCFTKLFGKFSSVV
jgi:DNA repair exonuclease SbcCD nuclease subunit